MNYSVIGANVVHQWYRDCVNELILNFGMVQLDDLDLSWVLLHDYPLPDTFWEASSPLLIGTPGIHIENHNAYSFFLDLDLDRLDGKQQKHLIDVEGYNPHRRLGYCRLSYHLQGFNPAYPIRNGDTLFDICQSLFHFLGQRW